eukprot:6534099-Ditylum_brightwellii.AAC.1
MGPNEIRSTRIATDLRGTSHKYTSEKNGLLEYESATGYLSAFKDYFVIKFKVRDSIKPFDEKMWKKYSGKLWQMKVAQAKAAQKLDNN